MQLFYIPMCFLLLLPCRSDTETYNSTAQIVPQQRYAYLPYNNCSEQDSTPCSQYQQCVTCTLPNNTDCSYGQETQAQCSYPDTLFCSENITSTETLPCQYCYQLISLTLSVQYRDQQHSHLTVGRDYECASFPSEGNSSCPSVETPQALYLSQCRVLPHVRCLGKRIFFVVRPCNYTNGYKWSTAFILSILLGGLGIDRLYLSHWQTALGKLFSFGGLGVWSLLDILLIGTGFLKPADGSLYQ